VCHVEQAGGSGTSQLKVRDMNPDVVHILEEHGIQLTTQRVAVAEYVLSTDEHPSADKVWAVVGEDFPAISRATVYNTLNLLVGKGLLRELHLAPDSVLFDANTERHHHFIDEDTGKIYDIPWNLVDVSSTESLPDFDVTDYQVVMRGRRRTPAVDFFPGGIRQCLN
jgi:Fe2+ or Zn2+ uptake regulation protein